MDPGGPPSALKEFVGLVDELRRHTAEVERACGPPRGRPDAARRQINRDLKPKMDELRAAGDMIESLVAGFAVAAADVSGSSVLEVR